MALQGKIKPLIKLLAVLIVPTLITHPVLWTVMGLMANIAPYDILVYTGEIAVIIAESFILRAMTHMNLNFCMCISLLANAASALLGTLLMRAFL